MPIYEVIVRRARKEGYRVNANSPEHALEMVENGDVGVDWADSQELIDRDDWDVIDLEEEENEPEEDRPTPLNERIFVRRNIIEAELRARANVRRGAQPIPVPDEEVEDVIFPVAEE